MCLELALSCESVVEFKTKHSNAYAALKNNGWYHEVLDSVFPNRIRITNHWTYETCKSEALKYDFRSNFQKGCPNGYKRARVNGWLDKICGHMKLKGNRFNKCIYVYEFPDNQAYVGLTFDIDRRILERASKNNDAVTKHINKTKLQPKLIVLTEYIPVLKAIKLEEYYHNKYKDNGWIMLNVTKTGSVGSVRKWTKEKCVNEAKKYDKRADFIHASNGAYEAAYRYGWLDDVLTHIPLIYKPRGYWSKERCEKIFKKYKSTKLVKQHAMTAYSTSHRNGWLNEFKKYLTNGRTPNNYWTKERCINLLKKCGTKSKFRNNYNSVYTKAATLGWLNDIYMECGL